MTSGVLRFSDIVISGSRWPSSDGLPSLIPAVTASSCASRTRSGAPCIRRFRVITSSLAGGRLSPSGSAISSSPTRARSSASRSHLRRYALGPEALPIGNAGSSLVPCAAPLPAVVTLAAPERVVDDASPEAETFGTPRRGTPRYDARGAAVHVVDGEAGETYPLPRSDTVLHRRPQRGQQLQPSSTAAATRLPG
jgi:hypothetical protein